MNENLSLIRKLICAHGIRLMLLPMRLLLIRRNRVLFESFRGRQYSCNPRYISEELKRLAGDRVEIAWNLSNTSDFPELAEAGVRVLRPQTWEFYKYALTARVVCVNTYYRPSLPRRRGQFFLRTWHGGGAYKRVGKYEKMPALQRRYIAMQQEGADLYLSSSRAFTEMTLRDSFGYKGEILETGMPRNDILVNGADEKTVLEVRSALGLQDGERFVLYAPTYRDDMRARSFALNHEALVKALTDRFGGTWRCAYRSHHVTMFLEKGENTSGVIDATHYPDMQKLLLAADVLVTDYSSSMWDMSLTFKPVFLYCPDLGDYTAGRDFFTDIHSWPFPLAEDNDALAENIKAFDENTYRARVQAHHDELGSYETGHAAHDAAVRIMKACGLSVSKEGEA